MYRRGMSMEYIQVCVNSLYNYTVYRCMHLYKLHLYTECKQCLSQHSQEEEVLMGLFDQADVDPLRCASSGT